MIRLDLKTGLSWPPRREPACRGVAEGNVLHFRRSWVSVRWTVRAIRPNGNSFQGAAFIDRGVTEVTLIAHPSETRASLLEPCEIAARRPRTARQLKGMEQQQTLINSTRRSDRLYQKALRPRRSWRDLRTPTSERPGPDWPRRHLEKSSAAVWGHDVVMSGGQSFLVPNAGSFRPIKCHSRSKRASWLGACGPVGVIHDLGVHCHRVVSRRRARTTLSACWRKAPCSTAAALNRHWNEGLLAIEGRLY